MPLLRAVGSRWRVSEYRPRAQSGSVPRTRRAEHSLAPLGGQLRGYSPAPLREKLYPLDCDFFFFFFKF